MKTVFLTLLALLAFAGNSVLCRLALSDVGGGMIDAAGFTSIRLLAGALTLVVLLLLKVRLTGQTMIFKASRKQLLGSTMLFLYAWCFSMAYLVLEAGSGALILFGFVQLTLLLAGWWFDKRPKHNEFLGMLLAFLGLVYWLIPVWGSPSLGGFVLMALAGVGWGVYTVAGHSVKSPLQETTRNFVCAIPLILLLNIFTFQPQYWTLQGVILAMVSGAVTSGVGYAVWYAVLPKLSSVKAAVIQLCVPILAALGGWVFMSETVDIRLLTSSVMVLAGLFMVIKPAKHDNSLENL